jgi:hypothetical protein
MTAQNPMKNIRLTTPAQHEGNNPAVDLHPASLERWLKDLPANDIIATIAKLDEALSAFNEIKVPAAGRLKLLEIYFAAFHRRLQGYDEMRIAQLKIPAKQKQQLCNDIMWLYIKLSHGYKIIVKDYVGESNNAKPPQYLLSAVFRALELTFISLIHAYRFALETPPLTYLEMHQLYACAEYYELLDKPVSSATGYAKTPTIASFYTLALIFINIDPRQYEPYTLEVLFLALQPFTFRCSIGRSFDLGENSFIYKINLNENEPPEIVVESELSSVKEGVRYLNIENFLTEITAWLEENKDKNNLLVEHELELFPTVITRLKVSLNESKIHSDKGGHSPQEGQTMKLLIGLIPLESLLIIKSVDLGLKLNFKLTEWTVQSESSTGCDLVNHISNIEGDLSLGELVAIVNEDSEENSISLVKIAHISSVQQLQQGVLHIALEYLSGAANPLTYIMLSEAGEAMDTTRSNGIYLLDETGNDDNSLMMINRKHYLESQHYLVSTREKHCTVVSTKLVWQTLRYAFFHYQVLQEERNSSSAINIINLAS